MKKKISAPKTLWIAAFVLTVGIVASSCKSKPAKEETHTANTSVSIQDDTLKGFMLAGVYFVQGYGGIDKFYDKIKKSINQDTSRSKFLTMLDTAYHQNFIYPFPRSTAEKVDARNTLSDWFQINNQNDFYLFLNSLKDSGFQAHYLLCRKVIDANGGANADVAKINLEDNHLPKGSEVLLSFVKENYDKFSPAGIKAWNIGLYVYTVCLGYGAEYTDAKNGKNMIVSILRGAEKNYSDWKTYYSDFMLGREFSGVDKANNAPYQKAIDGMLQGHYSMYTYLPL